jgi:hypothetical protein
MTMSDGLQGATLEGDESDAVVTLLVTLNG